MRIFRTSTFSSCGMEIRAGGGRHEEFRWRILLSVVRSAAEHDQSGLEAIALDGGRRRLGTRTVHLYGSGAWLRDRDIHVEASGTGRVVAPGDQGVLVGGRGEQGAEELALGSPDQRSPRRCNRLASRPGVRARSPDTTAPLDLRR